MKPERATMQDYAQRMFLSHLEKLHTNPQIPQVQDELESLDIGQSRCNINTPILEQVNDAPGGAVARPPQSQYYE